MKVITYPKGSEACRDFNKRDHMSEKYGEIITEELGNMKDISIESFKLRLKKMRKFVNKKYENVS